MGARSILRDRTLGYSAIQAKATTGIFVLKRFLFIMARIIPFIIALVLLVGLADSAYLAMRDLGIFGSDRELTSSTCPIFGGQDCETVMSAEDALPLGVPVVLGAVYFAVMLGAAAVRILSGKWLLPGLMVLGFLAGLAYSGYLTYTMVVVLRAVCPYCMLAHSLNVAAFALFITSLVLDIRFAHNRSVLHHDRIAP